MNNGVVLKPEGYKESCICKKSEREIRIGMAQKLNHVSIKSESKIFGKDKSVLSLFKAKESAVNLVEDQTQNYGEDEGIDETPSDDNVDND